MTQPSQSSDSNFITVVIDPDLEEILPIFMRNRRRDVGTLRIALDESDFKTVRLLGHRMKGDGGGYGFDAISEIGEVLEQAAIREDRPVITQQTDKLDDFLDRVQVVYRKHGHHR
ncbi:MAG TPA: Hpt domain-containing protein [Nitrospira sp.]|nr:Hpt domain-containing protein [Nitrospira sp.]